MGPGFDTDTIGFPIGEALRLSLLDSVASLMVRRLVGGIVGELLRLLNGDRLAGDAAAGEAFRLTGLP
jgi:hypothetical protein